VRATPNIVPSVRLIPIFCEKCFLLNAFRGVAQSVHNEEHVLC